MRRGIVMPSNIRKVVTNERNPNIRSPEPVGCRAKNYGYQGPLGDCRLRSQIGGFKLLHGSDAK